ncbi:MAG: sugar transferase [Acidobacteriota bacterium]|nr:sugar transferase [Acidobacteriota bacterium]
MALYRILKRAIDIVLSTFLLIALAPILLLVCILLLLFEGRPIFYNSRRYTEQNRSITVYKFRTMARDAKSDRYDLRGRFMREGFLDIPLTCEVFTPIGRLLERTQIVETPQFFNVIAGQMSLIGNRPLPRENVDLLKMHESWRGRFDSPAGISGIAQVVGKLNLQPAERLALETSYSDVYRNGNILKCDLVIFLYTIRAFFHSRFMSFDSAQSLLRRALAPSAPKVGAMRPTSR